MGWGHRKMRLLDAANLPCVRRAGAAEPVVAGSGWWVVGGWVTTDGDAHVVAANDFAFWLVNITAGSHSCEGGRGAVRLGAALYTAARGPAPWEQSQPNGLCNGHGAYPETLAESTYKTPPSKPSVMCQNVLLRGRSCGQVRSTPRSHCRKSHFNLDESQ